MSVAADFTANADGKGRWLTLLCLTLFGYALLGRGWAYFGVPPVYIGEVVLFLGMVSFLFLRWSNIFLLPAAWFLILLMAWGLCRTLPEVSNYGVDALRDAVIWGYGAFALIVCGTILARPQRLTALLRGYKQFFLIFPACVPVVWILCRFFPDSLPHWPVSDRPIVDAKGGDLLVHLAGILAFGVCGFAGATSRFRAALLALCVGLVGASDRAGLLSFLAVFAICFLHKPRSRSLWQVIGLGVCGLLFLAITDIHIQMPGREREISFEQLATNLSSVTGSTDMGDLEDTKEWRLQWWGDIIDYTVNGPYFWTGKGFGINLTEDDGYVQGNDVPVLRSPHNGHMTVLARTGVPGFILWFLVQTTWACGILGAYVRSRRLGEHHWPELFLFLLCYWVAFMINASFDVVLEGPHGGIWFWTIYGVGLAALWLYRYSPTALEWENIMDSSNDKMRVDGR